MNILLYPIPLPRVLNAAKKKELPKKELLQTHLLNEISAPPDIPNEEALWGVLILWEAASKN